MKKLIALTLAAIMLCSCFLFACGEEEKKEEGGVSLNTNEVEENKVLDLPELGAGGFNGHEFHFVSRKLSHASLTTHEIYAETLTGEKVNDAVFTRNAQIEKKYNCKITEEQTTSPAASAKEPLMAGEYYADILFDEARLLRDLAGKALLVDFSTLKNVNFKKDWYDKNAMDGLNLGNKIFFMTGDASTLDDRCAWVVWYNKDYVEEYDSEIDLYDEVRKGKWTANRLYELMVSTAKDLTGDGYLVPQEDRMGYVCGRDVNFGHVLACGVTMGVRVDNGTWTIPDTPSAALVDAWTGLKPLLTSPARVVASKVEYFTSGRGTFYAGGVGNAYFMGDCAFNVGVLPMPKLNEEQKEYTSGVGYSQLCCYSIPTTVSAATDWESNGFSSGAEQVAYFFEVFSCYSMNYLTPAFFNNVVMKQGVSDPESAEMVAIAMKNKIYDPIAGYNFGGINIYAKVGSNNGADGVGTDVNYDTLVSAYQAKVQAARKALQSYIKSTNFTLPDPETVV